MTESPIGVLGGIFDPVHVGHLSIASLALEFFKLDTVLFIPAGVPPHKSSTVTASAADRVEMLRLAISDFPQARIWDGEIGREGYSYTVDTLHQLSSFYPGHPLHFIIGSDNLREIRTWRNYREIISLVTLCVAHRPHYAIEVPLELKGARIRRFPSPEWGLSSTLLRTYLLSGYNCNYLIPKPVVEYIKRKKLYSGSSSYDN
jgi:nicotinate-nucleotide adenylyltransferase